MSVLKALGLALAASVFVSSQALALTVTNRDTSSHTVMIKKGDDASEHALPAGESLDQPCDEGCVLRLAGAEEEYPAGSGDRFVIEDGALQREQQ